MNNVILRTLFPQPSAIFIGRGGDEVNGLPKGTVPANCEIVAQGLASLGKSAGRQEHYLVRVKRDLVYLRVCTAMEGSGYDEYAVIHGVADTSAEKEELTGRALRFIESCCVAK